MSGTGSLASAAGLLLSQLYSVRTYSRANVQAFTVYAEPGVPVVDVLLVHDAQRAAGDRLAGGLVSASRRPRPRPRSPR